jgi:hypothetical protein
MEHMVLRALGTRRTAAAMALLGAGLGGVVVLAFANPPSNVLGVVSATPSPLLTPPVYDPGPPKPPFGIPGVPVTRPGQVPGYTESEVEAYVRTNPLPRSLPESQVATVTVSFQMAGDVSALLEGTDVGRPANVLVCYVEMSGTFYVAAPPKPGQPHATLTLTHGFAVFDAATGKLLLSGGRP